MISRTRIALWAALLLVGGAAMHSPVAKADPSPSNAADPMRALLAAIFQHDATHRQWLHERGQPHARHLPFARTAEGDCPLVIAESGDRAVLAVVHRTGEDAWRAVATAKLTADAGTLFVRALAVIPGGWPEIEVITTTHPSTGASLTTLSLLALVAAGDAGLRLRPIFSCPTAESVHRGVAEHRESRAQVHYGEGAGPQVGPIRRTETAYLTAIAAPFRRLPASREVTETTFVWRAGAFVADSTRVLHTPDPSELVALAEYFAGIGQPARARELAAACVDTFGQRADLSAEERRAIVRAQSMLGPSAAPKPAMNPSVNPSMDAGTSAPADISRAE